MSKSDASGALDGSTDEVHDGSANAATAPNDELELDIAAGAKLRSVNEWDKITGNVNIDDADSKDKFGDKVEPDKECSKAKSNGEIEDGGAEAGVRHMMQIADSKKRPTKKSGPSWVTARPTNPKRWARSVCPHAKNSTI